MSKNVFFGFTRNILLHWHEKVVEKITAIHNHGAIINKINVDGQTIMLWYSA